MRSWLLLLITITAAASAQFLLKLGAVKLAGSLSEPGVVRFVVRALSTPTVLLGLVVYGASAFLWVLVLGKLDLSFAYPMVASGYILVSLLSWGILNERMTVMKGMALLVIAVGVALLGLSQST